MVIGKPHEVNSFHGGEVRWHGDDVDEIVAKDVRAFHVERMTDEFYALILDLADGSQLHVTFGSTSGRAKVRLYPPWLDGPPRENGARP